MKVALVFNPFSYKIHEENVRTVQRYFGLFPPLSLAWVAAIIRDAGHDVTIIDARTLRLTRQETASLLKRFRPDVIGAMMTTYMFPETLSWLSYLKGELSSAGIHTKVLIGGYNLRIYPRESMAHPDIDFGCIEHAFHTVPSLLRELESGRNGFSSVPGLAWKKDGEIVINPHPQGIDFDKFPRPARDLLPNELYAEFPTQHKSFTVMVTSLGCPFRCNFCEASNCAYSPRSPETVVAEMEECVTRYGVREIDIFDYNFTVIPERVRRICRLIGKRNIKVAWACRSRVDTVDEGLLAEMQAAGCRRIYWGIEHSEQRVLDTLGKGISPDQVERTMRASRRAGIQNLGFFLVGVPGETKETIRRTVDYARSIDFDYVQFSKLLAKPGTSLWKEMRANGWRDYWADWVAGRETDRELPRPWLTTMDNREVDRLTCYAYLRYHTRLPFLFRHVRRCRSVTELVRKMSAYAGMVMQFFSGRYRIAFKAYPENILAVLVRKYRLLKRLSP